MERIVLASSSKSRKQAMDYITRDYTWAYEQLIDEKFSGRPTDPAELVCKLSYMKADAAANVLKNGVFLGFDSVGHCKQKLLEKPKDKEDARRRLQGLSGTSIDFLTGVTVLNAAKGEHSTSIEATRIHLRKLNDGEITRYLDQDSGFSQYELGFSPIHPISSSFIERIEGSYFHYVHGFPIVLVADLLRKHNGYNSSYNNDNKK